MPIDILEVLGSLRPSDDWGPAAQTGATLPQIAAAWRGANPPPTQAELDAEWVRLEATRTARMETANPERTAMRMVVAQLVLDCSAYAALAPPTGAQTTAFCAKVSVWLPKIVRRLAQLD